MMKTLLLILALTLVLAVTASAELKRPDVMDATFENPTRIMITGTLDSNSPTWNRGYIAQARTLAP